MKVSLISIGLTQEAYIRQGMSHFEKRIRHYTGFECITLNEPRNMKSQPEKVQKNLEAKVLLPAIEKSDCPILLDVAGRQFNSEEFSNYLQRIMNKGTKHVAFIIGGPFGFAPEVYAKVPERISISSMTFSHQLIRLIFMEQLYRAFTIFKGEPYHHA